MINFKIPEPGDKAWISDIVALENLRSADYTFGSIYCWSDHANTMVSRLGDRLLMRVYMPDQCYYAYPIGRGELKPAVELMMADAEKHDIPFIMRSITDDVLDDVISLFGTEPVISTDETFYDYVYSAEALANLSGRKYHSKKNHVNQFTAAHDCSFEPITPENIGECRDLASRWFEVESEARGTDYTSEIRAIDRTLACYFDCGFYGGLIRADGKTAAFTVGEMVSDDTLVTHFEKADPSLGTAFSVINQQFAAYMMKEVPSLVYINREEDMGIENLRKAKQSYHPAFMVKKYSAVWK